MKPTDYHVMLSQRGGMCCCGDHLGVMVGTAIRDCPMGWAFIDLAEATPERVAETIEHVKRGRSTWPSNDTIERRCNGKVRKAN
jgi:hypothetical protein